MPNILINSMHTILYQWLDLYHVCPIHNIQPQEQRRRRKDTEKNHKVCLLIVLPIPLRDLGLFNFAGLWF